MGRVMGVNAVGALNRVLGLFILAIGVNMIVEGVQNVWPSEPAVHPAPASHH